MLQHVQDAVVQQWVESRVAATSLAAGRRFYSQKCKGDIKETKLLDVIAFNCVQLS